MSALHELQQRFAAAILAGATARLSPHLAPMRLGPARRLQIYRNHFTISLAECLAATFPVLQRLVGETFFVQAARRFATTQPPISPVLFEYGEAFPGLLSDLAGAGEYAYLADVGAFEWAINHAYHADDASTIQVDALVRVPDDHRGDLRLILHPSVRLVASEYPVLEIWRANQADADPAATIDLGSGGRDLLVWRNGIDVVWRVLSAADSAFTAALLEDRTIGEAFVATAAVCGDDIDPGQMFADLIASDLLTGFRLPPNQPQKVMP